ncbi:MAG: hypothetical protein GQ578_02435, partial [Desulfuromonadaceae bacterium]|nr:hypothetical protein [Desulfuromonadaceae bacterium]
MKGRKINPSPFFFGPHSFLHSFLRWIADIKMPHPAQQIVLQEYVDTIAECANRVERLTGQIQQLLPTWQLF